MCVLTFRFVLNRKQFWACCPLRCPVSDSECIVVAVIYCLLVICIFGTRFGVWITYYNTQKQNLAYAN
jgi:hypothetical protein